MPATIVRGDARALPLPDASVDLIVTSPPYFALRSYEDGGQHYDGQIGSEPTPQEFLDALIACTAEAARVLKPTGSLWVNLGDKYADRAGPSWAGSSDRLTGRPPKPRRASSTSMAPRKSLLGLPWRYAIRCIDELGLILRAEVVWAKPNGLPESVTDRVRRSHEQWFHFTLRPHYFAAIDELREDLLDTSAHARSRRQRRDSRLEAAGAGQSSASNDLGKLPGSVWTVPSEPLTVPDHLDVDHFAAFPMEWPRRIITGWCPRDVCTACGQGRRPVIAKEFTETRAAHGNVKRRWQRLGDDGIRDTGMGAGRNGYNTVTVTGYECACPTPDAPSTPGVVLDPFGGTGTTALVADVLGRHGITVDRSRDYCRLAQWRINDPRTRAKAAERTYVPSAVDVAAGQDPLFELLGDLA